MLASTMPPECGEACAVPGALALALRVSRTVGIAPVKFDEQLAACRVRVSPAFYVYGRLLVITVCVLALGALVSDLCMEPAQSARAGAPGGSAVYFADLASMALVALAAAFTGSGRMKQMILYINEINKINLELGRYCRTPPSDERSRRLLAAATIGGTVIIALDFFVFKYKVISEHGKVLTSSLYVFYNLLYMTQLLAQVQFALDAGYALAALQRLNGALEQTLHEIQAQDVTKNKRELRDIPAAVRHLSGLSARACCAVRRVDSCHGPVLLPLLLSYLLHLVITLYCLINSFLPHPNSFQYDPVMQSLWGIFHISSLVIVVEPCHRTQEQFEKTKEIVSKMTQKSLSRDDPLAVELEQFFRQLSLDHARYEPLQVLTLNRALMVKMLNAITTYLVIVIDF